MFIEEPSRPELDVMAEIARGTHLPIATGERVFTKWGFREVLEKRAATILQPDLCHAGGITEVRLIAGMAEAYYAPIAPHNPLGPISLAAGVQIAASIPNFLCQEQVSLGEGYLKRPFTVREGYLDLPTGPGLGIELDEDAWPTRSATTGETPKPTTPTTARSSTGEGHGVGARLHVRRTDLSFSPGGDSAWQLACFSQGFGELTQMGRSRFQFGLGTFCCFRYYWARNRLVREARHRRELEHASMRRFPAVWFGSGPCAWSLKWSIHADVAVAGRVFLRNDLDVNPNPFVEITLFRPADGEFVAFATPVQCGLKQDNSGCFTFGYTFKRGSSPSECPPGSYLVEAKVLNKGGQLQQDYRD